MKIVITGGHHNAALVVARLLQKKGIEVVWFGHRYAGRHDTHDSAEYKEVKAEGIPFHNLEAGRFTLSPGEMIRLPVGLMQSYKLLTKEKPQAVLSFGGYLGAAVAVAAALLKIPLYLHEQTHSAGKANKLAAKLARRIYLTWPDSARYFDPAKTQVVGLPLRESILNAKPKPKGKSHKPTLLIMGGKQGAHVINQFIFKELNTLLDTFDLVHQTGSKDYERACSLKKPGYEPLAYIDEQSIGNYLSSASLYLGRSGAHITYELGIVGLPAILIPFMHTHDQEQAKNAEFLVKAGLAHIVPQDKLTLPNILASTEILLILLKEKRIALKLATNAGNLLVEDLLKDLRGT